MSKKEKKKKPLHTNRITELEPDICFRNFKTKWFI